MSSTWKRLRVKYPLLFSGVKKRNLNFLNRFSKKIQKSSFNKIRPVGVELLHADRRTGRQTYGHEETKSRFSQFCEKA